MGFINNLLPIIKKSKLKLIEKRHEIGDIYSFLFEKPANVTWNAGQHGIFTITSQKIEKATRPFSISSSQEENYIMITTHIPTRPSAFKQALFDMKPGMEIAMRGPVGGLFKPKRSPRLFIAGGIGITPYRPILVELAKNNELSRDEHCLIYVDRHNEFLFTKEFESMQTSSTFLVQYMNDREAIRLPLQEYIERHANHATYYIVGSKSFLETTEEQLRSFGIHKSNIRKDRFLGY